MPKHFTLFDSLSISRSPLSFDPKLAFRKRSAGLGCTLTSSQGFIERGILKPKLEILARMEVWICAERGM
jgi:hypothetical protein